MLQAVILAAGRSTRTLPLTDNRPKPLVPILGKPLLQHQLEQISGLVDEAIIVVGYLGDKIRHRFGERFGTLSLRYVEQVPQRGTADALRRAAPLIHERCLILNGDDLYHAQDLRSLLRHRTGLLLSQAPDPQNRAVVSISGDQVTDIVEKPASAGTQALCSVGAYSLERSALALLSQVTMSPRGELELPDLIRLVARSVPVRYHRVERIWRPVTYAWDVLETSIFLLEDPTRAHDFAVDVPSLGRLMERRDINLGVGTVLEGPVLIGPSVTFGNYCRVRGPAVIEAGSTFGDCVEIDRSVFFRGARVGEFSRIRHSVLGELVTVGPRARVLAEPSQGKTVWSEVRGSPFDTGLPLLGLIAGDGARVPAEADVPAGTLLKSAETYGSLTRAG